MLHHDSGEIDLIPKIIFVCDERNGNKAYLTSLDLRNGAQLRVYDLPVRPVNSIYEQTKKNPDVLSIIAALEGGVWG